MPPFTLDTNMRIYLMKNQPRQAAARAGIQPLVTDLLRPVTAFKPLPLFRKNGLRSRLYF